jgi:hypothetical protein
MLTFKHFNEIHYFSIRMNSDSFETTRIILIILVISLRMGLIRKYLQSYLNIAPQKLSFLKKETGRITNVDLQKLVNSILFL